MRWRLPTIPRDRVPEALLGPLAVSTMLSGPVQLALALMLGVPAVLGKPLFVLAAAWTLFTAPRVLAKQPLTLTATVCAGSWVLFMFWATFASLWSTSEEVLGDKLGDLLVFGPIFLLMGCIIGASTTSLKTYRFGVIIVGLAVLASLAIGAARGFTLAIGTGNLQETAKLFLFSYQQITFCLGLASNFALVEVLRQKRSLPISLWLVIWVLLSAGVTSAGGRSAAVGWAVAQAAILAFSLLTPKPDHSRKTTIALILIAPLIATGAVFIGMELEARTITKIVDIFRSGADTTGRQMLFSHAVDMAERHPIFGAGFASYQATGNNFEIAGIYPHNSFLEALAECGVVGLIFVLAAVATAVIGVLRDRHTLSFVSTGVWVGQFVMMLLINNVSGTITDRSIVFCLGFSIGLMMRAAVEHNHGMALDAAGSAVATPQIT